MKSRMPKPGTIVAVIALVLALGGTAIAVTKAPKNSVVSKSIKNGQVKTKDLKNKAVKTSKIANGAVTAEKLAPGAVPAGAGSGILGFEVAAPPIGGGLASLGQGPAIGSGDEFDLVVPVAAQLRDLAVSTDTTVAADRSAEVRINKVGGGELLSCTIPGGATSCTAAGPAAVAAGDQLSVEVFVSPGANAIGGSIYEAGYRLVP